MWGSPHCPIEVRGRVSLPSHERWDQFCRTLYLRTFGKWWSCVNSLPPALPKSLLLLHLFFSLPCSIFYSYALTVNRDGWKDKPSHLGAHRFPLSKAQVVRCLLYCVLLFQNTLCPSLLWRPPLFPNQCCLLSDLLVQLKAFHYVPLIIPGLMPNCMTLMLLMHLSCLLHPPRYSCVMWKCCEIPVEISIKRVKKRLRGEGSGLGFEVWKYPGQEEMRPLTKEWMLKLWDSTYLYLAG